MKVYEIIILKFMKQSLLKLSYLIENNLAVAVRAVVNWKTSMNFLNVFR